MTEKEFVRLKTEPLNIRTTPYSRYSAPARSETHPNSNYVRSSTPQPPFRLGFARRESYPWDVCFHCKSMGHWRKTVRSSTEPARIQLQHILNKAPNLSADTVNDKYFIDCNFFNCYENNVTEFEIFSEHVNYFENSKLHGSFKGVKGNLKKRGQFGLGKKT